MVHNLSLPSTATPWKFSYDDNGFFYIYAEGMPSPYIVATGGEGDADKGNIELIVRAVNIYHEVVEILRLAEVAIDDCHQYRSHNHHKTLGAIRDLIVTAEGRS